MKRNMDLVRKIAIAVEDLNDEINSTALKFDGHSEDEVAYHVELMDEAGLIKTTDVTVMSSKFKEFFIFRLSSKGHDFVDAARSETIWNKAKTVITSKVGSVSIDMLIQVLKSQAMSALGMTG